MNKKFLFCAVLLLACFFSFCQEKKEYHEWVQKAETYFQAKQFGASADAYSHAFSTLGWTAYPDDRYNAARACARANRKDSAFFHLNRLATKVQYADLNRLNTDPDLASLRKDRRWETLCGLVMENGKQAEKFKPIVQILDTIFKDDQAGRVKLNSSQRSSGYDSVELSGLWKEINRNDSINLAKVEKILNKFGWLGADKIGWQGNNTLFLVIQHANLAAQEKYLPMMREAVKNNNAEPSSLALLEDRVALRKGKKQIYGSQISRYSDGNAWVKPLDDPDNVDKRRASVGLGPIADYVSHWNIKWDVAAYKKQLPELEKQEWGSK